MINNPDGFYKLNWSVPQALALKWWEKHPIGVAFEYAMAPNGDVHVRSKESRNFVGAYKPLNFVGWCIPAGVLLELLATDFTTHCNKSGWITKHLSNSHAVHKNGNGRIKYTAISHNAETCSHCSIYVNDLHILQELYDNMRKGPVFDGTARDDDA